MKMIFMRFYMASFMAQHGLDGCEGRILLDVQIGKCHETGGLELQARLRGALEALDGMEIVGTCRAYLGCPLHTAQNNALSTSRRRAP